MRAAPLACLVLLAGCVRIGPAPPRGLLAVEQQAWWERLQALCGGSYPGRLLQQGSADGRYRAGPLTARVGPCSADRVEIGFDVGSERTRSWVLTRGAGLRLRHLNRDAAGAPLSPTDYGGETVTHGSARRQDFPADTATARLLPAASRNVWTLEIDPGRAIVYTLSRVGSARQFQVEFALPARE